MTTRTTSRYIGWNSPPNITAPRTIPARPEQRLRVYGEAVWEFRKAFITAVLRENDGNQSKAARELGMHRNTLSRTASAVGLDVRAVLPGSRRLPQSERLVTVAKRVSR